MDRELELEIIERCIRHSEAGTTTVAGAESRIDSERYTSAQRYQLEVEKVLAKYPAPILHGTMLPTADSFRLVDTAMGKLLFSRDSQGRARAFHNSCRHRGAEVVRESSGCARRFTCPYHAWSYTTDGKLASMPAKDRCFPDIERQDYGLIEIASVEKYGFVWLCPAVQSAEQAEAHLDDHLGSVAASLDWLDMDQLQVFEASSRVWRANWKLVSEGGLETYHFSYAHRETIGPYFLNNTAVTDQLGPHFRVAMPTHQIAHVAALPAEQRNLRDCTHTLFSIFPLTAFLVQKEHVDWIRFRPLSTGETEITITSLVPDQVSGLSEDRVAHWRRNLEITDTTLTEDFELAESIQRSLDNGALRELNFGRNEWALRSFNEVLDKACGD